VQAAVYLKPERLHRRRPGRQLFARRPDRRDLFGARDTPHNVGGNRVAFSGRRFAVDVRHQRLAIAALESAVP